MEDRVTSSLPDPAPLRAAYDLVPPVELFALPQVGTNNRITGVRSGGGNFVWKISQSFADPAPLRREHALLAWLAGRGLPFAVPAPVLDREGETLQRSAAGWGALFPLLPGERPDGRDPAQVEAVGAALGELHGALAYYPAAMWPDLPAYGDLDRIHPAIPAPEALTPRDLGLTGDTAPNRALAWWREHLIGLRAFIAGPYRALPRQMIHSDFALGNVLWHEGRLAAVLDFEFASADARAIDLASGLEFMLRPWDGEAVDELWPLATAFCRGYARAGALTAAEVAAIPWLIRLRDTVSTLWHTGRTLAHGLGERNRSSFEHLQGNSRWLTEHERRLVATIERALDPAEEARGEP